MTAPWRVGWRITDPGRPCYTCGAAPVSEFDDGSPRYPASCSHPPLMPTTPLDARPYGPVPIVLSPDDERRAKARAAQVVEMDRARGWQVKFDTGGESRLDINERGFGAEIAASLATGLPLNWGLLTQHYRRRDKPPDIGRRTEVRNAKRPNGRLWSDRAEPDHWLYLLVTGYLPRFLVVGWIEGALLRRRENWREPPAVRYEGYFVGRDALRPLAEMPGDA